MTLIELIGVILILSILSMALVPVLTQQIRTTARSNEQRRLQEIASAFESAASRTRQIPVPAEMPAWLGTEMGWLPDEVASNGRGLRRAFVIDPRLKLGMAPGSPLPFVQDSAGTANPIAARLVIVSSLSEPLPADVVSATPVSAADFDQIWSGEPTAIPSAWSWSGESADLFVQRIDMSPWFVPVVLNNQSALAGRFGADDGTTNTVNLSVQVAWFLRGTVLRLHGEDGAIQTREVIREAESFSYENRIWRGRIFAGVSAREVVGVDMQFAGERFTSAALNPTSKPTTTPTTPDDVLTTFVRYFQSYASWQAAGFSHQDSSPTYNAVKSAQAQMSAAVGNLISKSN